MPKKILILSHGASLCGAERSLLLLLQHLHKERVDPLVALARTGPLAQTLSNLGIRTAPVWCPWWVRLPSDKRRFWRYLWQEGKATLKLCRLILRENVDLVYTNSVVVFSGALAALLMRRPHVWHIREILPNNPDLIPVLPHRWILSLVRALSAVIVVNSQATGRQFQRAHRRRGFRVVPNAQPLYPPEALDQPLDLDGVRAGDWLVSMVGTFQRGKAQDDAVRAVALAAKAIPHLRLLLIGDGPREFTKCLSDLCDALGIADRVTFTGFRTDVPRILSHCRALVMPSCHESFGRVLLEAMAVGIPVIGARAGGISEVIEDGVTGYLVAPRAPEALAERLIHLYRNPHVAAALGAAGRQAVATRFDVDTYVRSLERVFAQQPPGPRRVRGALNPAKPLVPTANHDDG